MRTPRRRSIVAAKLEAGRGGSAQAAILAELRRCLLDGVPPGSVIPLDEVAAVFGVSRIPVREALKTLIGEGLVEHRPNFGYTVAKLTPEELHELYVVRGVLEAAALGAAVARAQPSHDEQARAAHAALADALAAGDMLDKTPIGHLTPPEITRQGVEMVAVCGKKATSVDTPKKKEIREKMYAAKYEKKSKAYLEDIRKSAMIEYRQGGKKGE